MTLLTSAEDIRQHLLEVQTLEEIYMRQYGSPEMRARMVASHSRDWECFRQIEYYSKPIQGFAVYWDQRDHVIPDPRTLSERVAAPIWALIRFFFLRRST